MDAPRLTAIDFKDDEQRVLVATWSDGHVSEYPLRYLRGWCPCAQCQGHGAGRTFVDAPGAALRGIETVGAYAVNLLWQGGHDTGIWSYDTLREYCPCDACGGPPPGTPDDVWENPGGAWTV